MLNDVEIRALNNQELVERLIKEAANPTASSADAENLKRDVLRRMNERSAPPVETGWGTRIHHCGTPQEKN
jgi:hypothetical protein